MFPRQNIHKYTWTSPDGKTHNQINHKLAEGRWHSSILDVRYFRGAASDTDCYLVVPKFGKIWRLINKQHRSLMGKELIPGRLVSWRLGNSIGLRSQTRENLNNSTDIKWACENI
jgi:hypothetical protein